ncbi:MAG: VIT domain-containing protein [bacterium]
MRLTKSTGNDQEESTLTGLFCGKNEPTPIPLIGVKIAIKVFDFASKVTVEQAFRNIEKKPIEAVYSFPLPESAAVCGFEVETNDKKLIGKVEESEKAYKLYDEAMEKGEGAFLLDQDRPNIFTANIGNLLPNSSAIVKITYVQELSASHGNINLIIPTTISPRYIPLEQMKQMDPVELDHITPPVVMGKVPYGLHLTAEIDLNNGVKSVYSPSHPVRIDLADFRAVITLDSEDIQLDQDFVLNIESKEPALPVIRFAKDKDEYAAMLCFTPETRGSSPQNSEVLFLLDRSGSMQGESIGQAIKALQICLHSLSEGDRFNIIGYGSTYEFLFSESADYNQETLDFAIKQVELSGANLGGTEVYAPLKKALKIRTSLPKKIVLITDGEFGNEEEVIKLCQHYKDSVTIFPVGIGRGVNEYVLKAIARVTGGVAEFIHPNERIEPKIIQQYNRLRGVGSGAVQIDWGEYGDGLMIPKEIANFFQGDTLVVYKTITAIKPSPIKLYLGDAKDTECWTMELDEQDVICDDTVPILRARRWIQEMEESFNNDDSERDDVKLKEEIIELGCRYGLMSSLTSYVAIETRPDADLSVQAEYRRVPISLTKGWGNLDAYCITDKHNVSGTYCDDFTVYDDSSKPSFLRKNASSDSVKADYEPRPVSTPHFKKKIKIEANLTHDELVQLINLQKMEGYWEYEPKLKELFEFTPGLYHQILLEQKLGFSLKMPNEVIGTILVLDILENKFKQYESEWILIAQKGYNWLEQQKIDRLQIHKVVQIIHEENK